MLLAAGAFAVGAFLAWLGGRSTRRAVEEQGAALVESRDPRLQAMQAVGYALWQLQVLEEALATFLVLRHYATLGMGEEAARPLVDKAEARTMGSLLHELVKKGSVDRSWATA